MLGVPGDQTVVHRLRVWKRHGNRVGRLAEKVAVALGLTPSAQRLVFTAGKYHDVGKLVDQRVSDLVHSARPLTEREAREVAQHSYYGAVFVRTRADALRLAVTDAAVVAIMIGGHHWWYEDFARRQKELLAQPEFSGQEHPEYAFLPEHAFLGARILKVVDAYVSMCEIRDYRQTPRTPQAAIEEIRRCRGTKLDPQVVDALLAVLLERGRWRAARSRSLSRRPASLGGKPWNRSLR